MLVYIEYLSRRPGVSLEGFHGIIGGGQTAWAGDYGEDRLILNVGRTWRLGPEPEYLAVWYTPDFGLERITDWERVFTSGEAAAYEEPFRVAARIDRAGCYEPLLEPVPAKRGPYYAEYFDFAPGASREEVTAFFSERQRQHSDLELNLLLDRIGRLGPDPRGLAFWSLPSYRSLAGIARELDGVAEPITLVTAGLYADLGKEIL